MKSHHKRGGRGAKGARNQTIYGEKQEILVQPKQSYSTYEEESNDDSKDFECLITTLPSAKGNFIFKSEKNWSADAAGCFESFTLDLKLINAALKCIPFNECVRIDNEYFTADQLTHFHNAAEEGKKAYEDILSNSETSKPLNKMVSTKLLDNESKKPEKNSNLTTGIQHKNNDCDNLDEDLDLLLSLEPPSVQSKEKEVNSAITTHNDNLRIQAEPLPTKPIDLESWLDSILDD